MSSPFPGPTPAYNNPPINPQYFKPSRFVISALTIGPTTTVTTSVDHNYVIGQLVRLLIQPTYGAYPLNEKVGYVIEIPSADEVVITIDSVGANPFISSPTYGPTEPQIVAIGDINTGVISSTGRFIPTTTIPGSFENISP